MRKPWKVYIPHARVLHSRSASWSAPKESGARKADDVARSRGKSHARLEFFSNGVSKKYVGERRKKNEERRTNKEKKAIAREQKIPFATKKRKATKKKAAPKKR
jgi:hypothetical protein